MRTKSVTQMYLDFTLPSSPTKIVAAYREKYGALNKLLLANPHVLNVVHADFCRWLSTSDSGRESTYTSEEILRSLVVMFIEGDSYRDVVVRIENSDFLRGFAGFGFFKPMMDFSFLGKAFAALSEETWQAVNLSLAQYAKDKAWISGEKLRTDTTAYEANIHYPTDSSLLWDSFRVLCRTLRSVQKELPQLGLKHRYHDRKVKKLAFYIARNAKSKSQGFDVTKEEHTDMVKAGIIDPAKVVRVALQNAASIAGMVLITEASVFEKPEDKKDTPAMPGGDMGGMGGMGGMM